MPSHEISDAMRLARQDKGAVPLHLVDAETLEEWQDMRPLRMRNWLTANGFRARMAEVLPISNPEGELEMVVVGRGDAKARARQRFALGQAMGRLPAARYVLHHTLDSATLELEALGWLLAGYRFDRFRAASVKDAEGPRLVAPRGCDPDRLEAIAAGEALTRDLINTPASHMGPVELEAAFLALAEMHGAQATVIAGADLLDHNLPLIHAVGRASDRAPRLLDMRWGSEGPSLTLVGKGVCFDTGGLNLKPGNSMGLMKKDMGGAATVLGLAHMIMALGWKVRLRVLVPAVENAVSASAMRPGDVLISRKGLSIEVNNTDAEGRLILADALALADEERPDAMICMATLTGAARVALGAQVAPFFTNDATLAEALDLASAQVRDPVWRLPLHPGYEAAIEPVIADLDNAPAGGMAGAITAALFVHRFVTDCPRFVHFDIYGVEGPSRPQATGQGARALLQALPGVLAL